MLNGTVKNFLPICGLLERMHEFHVSPAMNVMLKNALLGVVLILSLLMTFVGVRNKALSKYVLSLVFVLVAFDYAVDFLNDAAVRFPAVYGYSPKATELFVTARNLLQRNWSVVWCCGVGLSCFASFFIVLSDTRERLFMASLATFKGMSIAVPKYVPLGADTRVKVLFLAIGMFALSLMVLFLFLDNVRPAIYSLVGAFFTCYVVDVLEAFECGILPLLNDGLGEFEWRAVALTAIVGLMLQAYSYMPKKAPSE